MKNTKRHKITKPQGVQIQQRRNSVHANLKQQRPDLNHQDFYLKVVAWVWQQEKFCGWRRRMKCCCWFVEVKSSLCVSVAVTPEIRGSRQCWQFPPRWNRCCRRTGGFSRLPASRWDSAWLCTGTGTAPANQRKAINCDIWCCSMFACLMSII